MKNNIHNHEGNGQLGGNSLNIFLLSQKIANTLDPVPDVSIDNLLDTSDVYFTDLTKILNYNRTESPIEVGSSISEIEFNAQQAACRRKAQTLKEQLEAINSDVFIKMNSAQGDEERLAACLDGYEENLESRETDRNTFIKKYKDYIPFEVLQTHNLA